MLPTENRFFGSKSTVFWTLFALIGLLLALRLPAVEILLGVMAIFLGVYKLGDELDQRKSQKDREALQETLQDIRLWIEKEYEHLKRMETRYETRFFRMDSKLIAANRKAADASKLQEKAYRDLVRKILDLENRMNRDSRAFLAPQPRSGRGKG